MKRMRERLEAALAAIPYARFLGVRMELAGDEVTAILPYEWRLVGNPFVPALHGGVIGAFMEMTALAQLSILHPPPSASDSSAPSAGEAVRLPRPLGVTADYLRSGRPADAFARAEVKRVGRRIANVSVEAWQETRAAPIALLSARFLLPSRSLASDAPPSGSHPVQPPG